MITLHLTEAQAKVILFELDHSIEGLAEMDGAEWRRALATVMQIKDQLTKELENV